MTTLLNRRSDSHRFLCLLLAALTAATPAASLAQQPGPPQRVPTTPASGPAPASAVQDKTLVARPRDRALDASLILPDACAVIALRPAQIFSAPLLEMFPTEVVQAALVKEIGLDPTLAEQVVVSAAPPTQGPPQYAVLATFSKPFKMKPSGITEHTEKSTLAGKPYLKSSQPLLPSFYPLSDKILLAAPEHTLPHFAQPQPVAATTPGRLATQFVAASKGDDLLAMVDVEALRPLINMALSQAPLPPELAPLAAVPDLVRQIELRVNLSHPAPSELIATANNEADAAALVKMFDDAKQQMMARIDLQAREGLASEDPVEQAGARYSQRMARMWNDRLQLVQEGDRLIVFHVEPGSQPNQEMITLATIGILVALLLPAVQAARAAALRNVALNEMKQIVLALLNYESAHKSFPAQANFDDSAKPLLSWRVHILPYIEQQALYRQFRLDEPWDSVHNKKLIPLMPEVYLHPKSKLTTADGKTHFLGVQGEGHVFDGSAEGRQLKDITDGTTPTIAIVEVNDDRAAVWTKPEDWTPDAEDPLKGLGGLLAGDIFLAGFCDGRVTPVSKNIDATILRAMFTIAGGEAIPQF